MPAGRVGAIYSFQSPNLAKAANSNAWRHANRRALTEVTASNLVGGRSVVSAGLSRFTLLAWHQPRFDPRVSMNGASTVASTFDVLDAIAFLVFAVLITVATVIIVFLGQLPGRLARQRAHPQAAAINVAGWLGLATPGLLWPIAFIWAFVSPASASPLASRSDRQGSEVDASAERPLPVHDPATFKQIRP